MKNTVSKFELNLIRGLINIQTSNEKIIWSENDTVGYILLETKSFTGLVTEYTITVSGSEIEVEVGKQKKGKTEIVDMKKLFDVETKFKKDMLTISENLNKVIRF